MNIITDSFTYAFRESGKYMLLTGAVMNVIASIAMFAPIFGIFAYLFLAGYFCSTYFGIIESTAVGDSEAPQFPDASNILQDLIWPLGKVVLIFSLALAPYLACSIFVDVDNVISLSLLFLGLAYFPMAMLAVVVLGYVGAMSPTIVLPGIFRAGWQYWFAVVLLGVIYFLEGVISDAFGYHFIIRTIIMGLVSMYVLMTSGRILGLVYKNKQEELNWL